VEKYKKILKENKLKITPKRMEMIKFFDENEKYFSAYDVFKYLKGSFKKIGFPTVYRNLEYLSNIGILTKLKGKDMTYYGICKSQKTHHHHIRCIYCNKVSDFYICDFDNLKQKIEEKTGFDVKEHEFFLTGICKDCKGRIK
jgi:Fe2+ or Zn2+ uptake regulation protein